MIGSERQRELEPVLALFERPAVLEFVPVEERPELDARARKVADELRAAVAGLPADAPALPAGDFERPRVTAAVFDHDRNARARPETLWLHAGVHKTGSTSLQVLLARNAERLARRGIAVVPQYIPWGDGDRGRTAYYREHFRKPLLELTRRRRAPRAQRAKTRDELRELLGAPGRTAPTVVFSDEDLLGPRPPQAPTPYPTADLHVRRVANVFPADRFRVVLYLREGAGYLESCYVQNIQMGRQMGFEAFLDRLELDRFSWRPVVESIAREIGDHNVVLRRFETIKTGFEPFARDFMSLFTEADGLDYRPVEANASLSALGCELALAGSPLLDADQWRTLRRFLQRHFSSRALPRVRALADAHRQSLTDQYERDLAALRENFEIP